jgi:hypothetical protein
MLRAGVAAEEMEHVRRSERGVSVWYQNRLRESCRHSAVVDVKQQFFVFSHGLSPLCR